MSNNSIYDSDQEPKVEKQMQTDSRIKAGVETALLDEGRAAGTEQIQVKVQDGVVVLKGTVDTLETQRQAIEAAESLLGVRAVVNQTTLNTDSYTDSAVRDCVLKAFSEDPVIRRFDLKVDVVDGCLLVSGDVDTLSAARLCLDVACSIRGVKDIHDSLSVKEKSTRSDEEILQDIESALKFDARVKSKDIDITVSRGRVFVSGFIGFPLEKRFIKEDACTKGVLHIDLSGLDVTYPRTEALQNAEERSDEQIITAVNDAMARDARVHYFQVEVLCSNARVILEGEVEGFRAKLAAEQDAQNTVGVKNVENRIKVHLHQSLKDEKLKSNVMDVMEGMPSIKNRVQQVSVSNGNISITHDEEDVNVMQALTNRLAGLKGVRDILFRDT